MSDTKTYEGETCAGCVFLRTADGVCECKEPVGERRKRTFSPACEHLERTLQCRAVRAAERQADALENLATVPPFLILPPMNWKARDAAVLAGHIRRAIKGVQAEPAPGPIPECSECESVESVVWDPREEHWWCVKCDIPAVGS